MGPDKASLRKSVRAKRRALSPDEGLSESRKIVARLLAFLETFPCETVLAYASFDGEVETADLRAVLRNRGKNVLLPRVEGEKLVTVPDPGDEALVKSALGVPEPQGPPRTGPIDLILVPGLAFDVHGRRLGFGKGYYDRFLADHPESLRAALAFSFQIFPDIPSEPHDQPVHILIGGEFCLDLRNKH